MKKIKLDMMNVTTFILNGTAAAIAVLFYFLGVVPTRESNFKVWIICLIFMSLYGLVMLGLMVLAIVIERRKIIIKGPVFSIYGYSLVASEYDKSYEKEDRWYISIEYSVTNKGDVTGLFEYSADLILDVKDHKGEFLSSKSSSEIRRKIKAKEIMLSALGRHFSLYFISIILMQKIGKKQN